MVRSALLAVSMAAGVVLACAANSRETDYVRSPSLDYGREPPRTSDNRVVGADGVDPNDRLQEGARVGRPTALSPGWSVEKGRPVHRPEDRAGGYGESAEHMRETGPVSADGGAE